MGNGVDEPLISPDGKLSVEAFWQLVKACGIDWDSVTVAPLEQTSAAAARCALDVASERWGTAGLVAGGR